MSYFASPLEAESLTSLFERARLGDRLAAELVFRVAFPRLRKIAGAILLRHRSHWTLQPTALVSELCLKLRLAAVSIESAEHFFRISARAMHQVLTDRGRGQAARRAQTADIVDALYPNRSRTEPETSAGIREILARLEKIDRSAADIVRRHYVEGYTWEEIARTLGRPVWKVRDDAGFALNWMRDQLG